MYKYCNKMYNIAYKRLSNRQHKYILLVFIYKTKYNTNNKNCLIPQNPLTLSRICTFKINITCCFLITGSIVLFIDAEVTILYKHIARTMIPSVILNVLKGETTGTGWITSTECSGGTSYRQWFVL